LPDYVQWDRVRVGYMGQLLNDNHRLDALGFYARKNSTRLGNELANYNLGDFGSGLGQGNKEFSYFEHLEGLQSKQNPSGDIASKLDGTNSLLEEVIGTLRNRASVAVAG
jgi:hypothetical protein